MPVKHPGFPRLTLKPGPDVRMIGVGIELRSRPLVGESLVVPRIRELRPRERRNAGEVRPDETRSRRTERGRRGGAAERLERREDLDLDVTVEGSAPDAGGVLEGDEALLPRVVPVFRRPALPGRVVEAHARGVAVHDGDGRGSEGWCRRNDEQGHEGEEAFSHDVRSHGSTPSRVPGSSEEPRSEHGLTQRAGHAHPGERTVRVLPDDDVVHVLLAELGAQHPVGVLDDLGPRRKGKRPDEEPLSVAASSAVGSRSCPVAGSTNARMPA